MYPCLNDSLNYKYTNRIKDSFSPHSNIDVPCLARCKLKFHSLSSGNLKNTWAGLTDIKFSNATPKGVINVPFL